MNDSIAPPPSEPAPPQQPAQQARPLTHTRTTAGHWVAIIILLLALGASALLNIGLLAVLAGSTLAGMEGGERNKFTEETVHGRGGDKVVQLNASGIITFSASSGLFFEQQGLADRLMDEIKEAEKDSRVLGILLVVDSPGGGVTASDILYDRLVKFKTAKGRNRKIVVLMRDLAASGGYYISMAGDKVLARRATNTGSIGVILSTLNLKALGDKIGIKGVTIASGENKDMLNPLRDIDPEDTNILQTAINDLYDRFVSVVSRSRGLDAARVRTLADGRIYTANQALEAGLIDEIGYEEDARETLKTVLGTEDFKIVRYRRVRTFMDILNARLDVLGRLPYPLNQANGSPQFMYLWQPAFTR